MILNPLLLRSSLSRSFLVHSTRNSRTHVTQKPFQNPVKNFWRNLNVPSAACYLFDEIPSRENEGDFKGVELLDLMTERGVTANIQTYLWILDVFLHSGCFVGLQMVHGRILKTGFNQEYVLSDRLIDLYLAANDWDGVTKVLNDRPDRSVHIWNKILGGFVANKNSSRVLDLFLQMVKKNMSPSELTFVNVFKACGVGNFVFSHVKQIHARSICHGFVGNRFVCNPLIDLYAKNGFIDSARKVFDKLSLKDSVSWVAMISGLAQSGNGEQALRLFYAMHTSDTFLTPYVFSSVLSACAKVELFGIGEQIHALVFKWGYSLGTYVCNALVTLYSRLGNFISAQNAFSKMHCKDGVSYNSLISGLAQRGYSDKALALFEQMQLDYFKPDCVTVASLLSACASTGALSKGQQLHAHVIKAGMSSDIIIEGSLLDLYVKCSDIRTAHEFFLTAQKENVVLWNVMLVAYGLQDNLSDSFQIFKKMQIEGLIPNQFTYPSILRTCTSLGALDLGEQIHTQVIKTGFQFNAYVSSVLIDMYAKHGKLGIADGILRRIVEEDVVSWTALIAGYTQHDFYAVALKVFKQMLNRGILPDNIGFSSAITSCAGMQALNQGMQIHAQSYAYGYLDDLSIKNALVYLYAKCGRILEAYTAFEKISAKDNITWNGLISGFAQSGFSEEALKVFAQMNRTNVEPSFFTFGSAVSAAANMANIKQGKQVHAVIIKRGFASMIEVSNALVTLYAKSGVIDDAKREFFEMPNKNGVSWNAMITGYSQHGCGHEAIDLFEEMKQVGEIPNHVTFVGVLSACSHVGLINEGLGYFESMTEEHGVIPKPEHYACIVDLLSRAGSLNGAKKFIEEMPIEPDGMVWRSLLRACIVHKNIEIGEFAAHHLLELEPEDSATYVLLSNMYAVTGKWVLRDQTRKMMKNRGVKKEPGRSWIEIKGSVHPFFAGDRYHPLADKIYEFLADLNKRAAAIGYEQDKYSLLNDLEQEHNDATIYIHSEKLAISFGLLSLSDAMPIHVMKNLRVCNDCHTWIKFVSKITNRAIVVRDAYRFHHFEGGVCSCRDYW